MEMILTANSRAGPTIPTSELTSIPQHRPASSQLIHDSCPVQGHPQPAVLRLVYIFELFTQIQNLCATRNGFCPQFRGRINSFLLRRATLYPKYVAWITLFLRERARSTQRAPSSSKMAPAGQRERFTSLGTDWIVSYS